MQNTYTVVTRRGMSTASRFSGILSCGWLPTKKGLLTLSVSMASTARERYDLLMQRCPGIVEHLDLQDIASFLNVHPNTISKIHREITFDAQE